MLQLVSTTISNWFLFNGLQLNGSKSEILLVGTQEKRRAVGPSLSSGLTIAGAPISLSSSSKILGVTFDPSMSFDLHISEICKSANYHLRALAHIRKYLSVSSAKLVATSIISSRLDYCNSVLMGLSAYNLHRLQCVQNRAARIVLGVGRRTSPQPLLRELHWLPVEKRILYKTALLTFKTLSSQQPAYLSSLLVPYVPLRSLRSSSGNFLVVPRATTAFQSRSFSVAAPKLWNALPDTLRSLPGLPSIPLALQSLPGGGSYHAFLHHP